MIGEEKKQLPRVRRHPEVLDILTQIARGQIDAEEGYKRLAASVQVYLWDGACEGHGELIGNYVFEELTSATPKGYMQNDSPLWAELSSAPASPLAVARGVLELSLLFGAVMHDIDVQQGARRLYKEYMTSLFPPSPLLFQTTFSTVRKRMV